ncbi:MAG TPA: NAD(P)H-binding protein, partial [Agromyces sp.]
AMAGVDVVLHLAGGPKGDDVGTRNVAEAARAARVGHLVMISVIGAESMPIGYFRRKAESERILAESGVPWTVVRAAQFHGFAYGMANGMAKLPIVPVMKDVRLEPVAVQDVAARLAEQAIQPPQGRVADLAGPEVRSLESLIDELPVRHRPHLRFGLPGAVGRAYRSEANLAGAGAARGTGTWTEFLEAREAARP